MSEQSCIRCAWAEWGRTRIGKLHPDGEGKCTVKIEMPVIPRSMYWAGSYTDQAPRPAGGQISRREKAPHRDCPHFKEKEDGR